MFKIDFHSNRGGGQLTSILSVFEPNMVSPPLKSQMTLIWSRRIKGDKIGKCYGFDFYVYSVDSDPSS